MVPSPWTPQGLTRSALQTDEHLSPGAVADVEQGDDDRALEAAQGQLARGTSEALQAAVSRALDRAARMENVESSVSFLADYVSKEGAEASKLMM